MDKHGIVPVSILLRYYFSFLTTVNAKNATKFYSLNCFVVKSELLFTTDAQALIEQRNILQNKQTDGQTDRRQ